MFTTSRHTHIIKTMFLRELKITSGGLVTIATLATAVLVFSLADFVNKSEQDEKTEFKDVREKVTSKLSYPLYLIIPYLLSPRQMAYLKSKHNDL